MVRHPRTVEGFNGSLEQLAKAVGNMTYDETELFIGTLSEDIRAQADADLARGRPKLAAELYETADKLEQAKNCMGLAWKTCEPYMKD